MKRIIADLRNQVVQYKATSDKYKSLRQANWDKKQRTLEIEAFKAEAEKTGPPKKKPNPHSTEA